MALMVAKTMGGINEDLKTVHPFFERSSKTLQVLPNNDPVSILAATCKSEVATEPRPTKDSGMKNRINKPAAVSVPPLEESRTSMTTIPNEEGQELLDVDPNNGRRKRLKSGSPESKSAVDGTQIVHPSQVNQERCGRYHQNNLTTPVAQTDVAVAAAFHKQLGRVPEKRHDQPAKLIEKPIGLPSMPLACQEQEKLAMASHRLSRDILQSISVRAESRVTETPTDPEVRTGELTVKTIPEVTVSHKKVLRLNMKTGTIGSPPRKKSASTSSTPVGQLLQTRGRSKSFIVTICYGDDEDVRSRLGKTIDQVLQSTDASVPSIEKASHYPPRTNNDFQPAKNTHAFFLDKESTKPVKAVHPFFLGKVVMRPPTPDKLGEATQDVAEPPCPKAFMVSRRGRPGSPEKPIPSPFLGSGRSERILKFPGAIEPAWPWRGMVHIRGCVKSESGVQDQAHEFRLRSRMKKAKYQAVEILAHEDVINVLANELGIPGEVKKVKETDLDDFNTPPSCLRVPTKHFEVGLDLQRRVRRELHAKPPPPRTAQGQSSSEDELHGTGHGRAQIHPALMKMYTSITTSVSAFDQSQCETQSWIHKYSPKSAAEVLQSGREALILREWLMNLIVIAVDTGASDKSRHRAASVGSRRSGGSKPEVGKRKRKNKLDGFVVSSGGEDSDMDEISDPEDQESLRGSQGPLKKTVIRSGDAKRSKESGRLSNAVVISGSHGCGKTAAVYAVAKELGFEVFEINASSRRSGKDVLEKVGEMTRNHLVQRSDVKHHDPAGDDIHRISDALADDLKSGRQGTMNSFFKPKEPINPKLKAKKKPSNKNKTNDIKDNSFSKAPRKQQKQSLILLEEVDILYEEDKQFWATILTLISQSKRPIIMTCTDESVVPLTALPLHAIIRFTPVPTDLAADYMLLVAANEGHAIRRQAVKALYESRHLDLRASLMELDFWCQFTVGDCKGGLEWFYPRWPRGCDTDEHGNTIRVVSEETYQTGMGWLCQDFLESHLHHLDSEEQTLQEAWNGWNMDIGDWQKNLDMSTWATKLQAFSKGKSDDLVALNIYDEFAEAMSVADLCSGPGFASDNNTVLDVSLPELTSKSREDYILAYDLLEATPLVSYDHLGTDISIWMKSRARKYLQVDQHIQHGWEIPIELERPTTAQTLQLIRSQSSSDDAYINRRDFSLAFDPISEPEKTSFYNTGSLEASTFDRSVTLIATDIAPYVRSIVSYDARLQQDRARLSNLLSEGGRQGKRMRTTRAAMSALEGGTRSTTRRDRYFGPNLNPIFVLRTGLQSWRDAARAEMVRGGCFTRSSSKGYSDESNVEGGLEPDDSVDSSS